jgi:hypothetical protein
MSSSGDTLPFMISAVMLWALLPLPEHASVVLLDLERSELLTWIVPNF